MPTTGWDRSLNTSKNEQGILTPPQPHRWHCGCWFRGRDLMSMCHTHDMAFRQLVKNLLIPKDLPIAEPVEKKNWVEEVKDSFNENKDRDIKIA